MHGGIHEHVVTLMQRSTRGLLIKNAMPVTAACPDVFQPQCRPDTRDRGVDFRQFRYYTLQDHNNVRRHKPCAQTCSIDVLGRPRTRLTGSVSPWCRPNGCRRAVQPLASPQDADPCERVPLCASQCSHGPPQTRCGSSFAPQTKAPIDSRTDSRTNSCVDSRADSRADSRDSRTDSRTDSHTDDSCTDDSRTTAARAHEANTCSSCSHQRPLGGNAQLGGVHC